MLDDLEQAQKRISELEAALGEAITWQNGFNAANEALHVAAKRIAELEELNNRFRIALKAGLQISERGQQAQHRVSELERRNAELEAQLSTIKRAAVNDGALYAEGCKP